MNKHELRIGNLVTDEFYPDFDCIITVESLNDKGINLGIESSNDYPEMQSHWIEPYYAFEQLRGIPLSEQWLIDMGFEKTIEVTWSFGYHKEYNVYRKDGLTYNGIQAAWWYHGLLKRQPEYVHQLQNLYFALTGSELTIKKETV
jgi:hypothetical protein